MLVKYFLRTKNLVFWTRRRNSSSLGIQFTYSEEENTCEKEGETEVNKRGSDSTNVVLVQRISQLKKAVIGEGVKPSRRFKYIACTTVRQSKIEVPKARTPNTMGESRLFLKTSSGEKDKAKGETKIQAKG